MKRKPGTQLIKYIVTTSLLFIIPLKSFAQIPDEIKAQFQKIIYLIENDSVNQLSNMIEYPLKRENPIPDIKNPKEFIRYYPIIFDKAFKDKLKLYKDSEIFDHNGGYGLVGDIFNGQLWLSYDGKKITAINYQSEIELKLKEDITKINQSKIHSSVSQWIDNRMVCKGKGIIIRIDNTKQGLRYVSWTGGHNVSDKPDLVLFNGKETALGTMGLHQWKMVIRAQLLHFGQSTGTNAERSSGWESKKHN